MTFSVTSFDRCSLATLGNNYIKDKKNPPGTSFRVIKQLSIKKIQQCILSTDQSTQG